MKQTMQTANCRIGSSRSDVHIIMKTVMVHIEREPSSLVYWNCPVIAENGTQPARNASWKSIRKPFSKLVSRFVYGGIVPDCSQSTCGMRSAGASGQHVVSLLKQQRFPHKMGYTKILLI